MVTRAPEPGKVLKHLFRGYCLDAELGRPNVRLWLSFFCLDVEQLLGSGGTHVFGHVERKQLLWLAYATQCIAAQRHEAVC